MAIGGLLAIRAVAQTSTWDGGTGAWTEATNWADDQVPAASATANISDGGVATVSAGDSVEVGLVNVGNDSGSSGALTVSDGAFDASVILVGNEGSGTLTIDGGSVSVGGITAGFFTGSTGTVNITGGDLTTTNFEIGNNGIGTVNLSGGTVTVNGNSYVNRAAAAEIGPQTLNITGGTWDAYGEFNISYGATGTVNLSGGGTLNVWSEVFDMGGGEGGEGEGEGGGASWEPGEITMGWSEEAVSTMNLGDGGEGIGTLNAGSIFAAQGSAAIVFNHTGTATFTPGLYASFDSTLTVTKNGSGTLVFAGQNSDYEGATWVNAGALLNNGTLDGTDVTVAAGATLGGSGFFEGDVTLSAGAILAPGGTIDGVGTLTFEQDLVLNAATIIELQLGTLSDLIVIDDGILTGPSAGFVTLNFSDAGGFAAGDYTLFDYSTGTVVDLDPGDFVVGDTIEGYSFSFLNVGSTLVARASLSAVPEPSTYAALAGVGVLGLAVWRRRRSAKINAVA